MFMRKNSKMSSGAGSDDESDGSHTTHPHFSDHEDDDLDFDLEVASLEVVPVYDGLDNDVVHSNSDDYHSDDNKEYDDSEKKPSTARLTVNSSEDSSNDDDEEAKQQRNKTMTNDEEEGQVSAAGGNNGGGGGNYDYPYPVGDVTCWKSITRNPCDFLRLNWGWLRTNKSQVLSGITVALAQVPEAVSFSFVAGVDPIIGLQSAWIMGLVTSLTGGRPGMVAGATGAVAVVLTNLVHTHGIGYMFYAVMMAGIIQMLFGICRLGKVMRMVPHSVMVGFCNGLGLVIGLAQFSVFKVPFNYMEEGDVADAAAAAEQSHRHLAVHLFGAFAPFTNGQPWLPLDMIGWMIFHIIITILTYILFPKLTKAVPGSLAGILVSTILEWALVRQVGYKTNTVADIASVAGSFPSPIWLDTTYGYAEMLPEFNGELITIILPTAITAAIIGVLESLLTLEIIDDLTNTKGAPNREAFGQGLGQFLSGMFGGMGGCTTIGQSLMNIHSGGFTRLSSSVAAFFMLLIILVAYPLINLIPVASLAGVMFLVTYFTIEWESGLVILGSCLPQCLRQKSGLHSKVKRSDVFIMLTVVAITLILDLAVAVACGIVLSCVIHAWDAGTRVHMNRTLSDDGTEVVYEISGPIFFGSVKPLLEMFPSATDDPANAVVMLEGAEIYDWSGMSFIRRVHDRFERNGTEVHFKQLNVKSHRLMAKSKKLWEGINVFEELEDENEKLEEEAEDDALVVHVDNVYHAHL